MTEAPLAVDGNAATGATVYVPNRGVWYADVDLAEAPDLSGGVTLAIGDLLLVGTVDARADGTRRETRRTRIVGGAGQWGASLPAKHYHNDAGVKALLVAQDAAREAGETLGAFAPTGTVGVDYVRAMGPASRALEDVIGSSTWWVDFDGVTQVGERPTSTPVAGAVVVEEYDPRTRVATLAMDDIASVAIGSVLSDGLDAPQTIRDLEFRVNPDSARVLAWCGADGSSSGRFADLLRGIVGKIVGELATGPILYRVSRVTVDRVELQIVNRRDGLPDLLPVSMWPGVAGVHATLTPGAEVLVEFVDGDRTRPIITHFAGKGGAGFVPVRIDFGESPTSFLALADLVATELSAFRTWANSHTHTGVTAGGGVTGTATTKGAIGSVASVLVRST